MLQQLSKYMPVEALGFMPGRETAEVWLLLQAQIEVMLSYDEPLGGLSSDVKRAFNHIGRKQTFFLGEHLGYPQPLLQAWQKFLANFLRRFDVHGCLGACISSNNGFPEGDPLSILAMLTVNWGYHVYMKVFVPRVQAFSFVDNMTLAAREAVVVIQGYFAMLSFMSLFGLTMDEEKTFVWGLDRSMRQHLQSLGFPNCFAAQELGAAMTYGHQIRNRLLKARGLGLEDKWARLRRSYAPTSQKIIMLPRVFWPKALYGAPSCVFSDTHLTMLRRAAVKSLGLNGAGSNPLLRLSLSNDMCCDPGFFQLSRCVATLRRMAIKAPDLLPLWQLWQHNFAGKLQPGPFTKLVGCLSQIGWHILEPPWVVDHDQHTWNLLLMDDKSLDLLLRDAWCQYVAASVNHKTMQGLHGMDFYLTTFEYTKLAPLERALLSSLQSGAFISEYEHAKYDAEKRQICLHCQCEDDRAHWLSCPRFQSLRLAIEGWCPDNVELPRCTTHHLLVPRQQAAHEWRSELLKIPDRTDVFFFASPANRKLHVFIDGSCTVPVHFPS